MIPVAQNMFKSWKTTLFGILTMVAIAWPQIALLFDDNADTNPEWSIIVGAIMTFLGLSQARDNDKRSEVVGAK